MARFMRKAVDQVVDQVVEGYVLRLDSLGIDIAIRETGDSRGYIGFNVHQEVAASLRREWFDFSGCPFLLTIYKDNSHDLYLDQSRNNSQGRVECDNLVRTLLPIRTARRTDYTTD